MEYGNPAANLAYVMPDGKQGEVWALNEAYANTVANAPFLKKFMEDERAPVRPDQFREGADLDRPFDSIRPGSDGRLRRFHDPLSDVDRCLLLFTPAAVDSR